MSGPDDATTEIEQKLARELETRLGAGGAPAAPQSDSLPGAELHSGLAAPLEALAKLRDALRPVVNLKIPEIPGFSYRGELGRGGMGVVMRAYDAALEREVAIKFLAPEFATEPTARERFLREARSLAKVRHPNLVAVHAAGEIEGRPYFAMELVEGTSLDRAILKARKGEGGVLPVDAPARARIVARVILEAAEALTTIHRAGLLHRDVKPANILIATDGSARLADFGISVDRRRGEEGGDAGTLRYLSPERISGVHGEEDPRSDVYALGLTMLESLTLGPAFTQKAVPELRAAILAGLVMPTGERVRGIDAKLLVIAQRAAARNAADRYADAAEMARALREAMDGRRIFTKPIFIAFAAVALVSAGVGIAALAGAFGGRNANNKNSESNINNQNINNPRGGPRPPFDGPPGPRDPRAPGGRRPGPAQGAGPMDSTALAEEMRIFLPAIPRLRDASSAGDWERFRREAERVLEEDTGSPPAKIARAWILVLQEKPEPEKARDLLNTIPPPPDPNVPNPIEKQRHDLLDFLDGGGGGPGRRPPRNR